MKEVVRLDISHFRFAIGGEHYYGKFHVQGRYEREVKPDGSVSLVSRGGYGVERHPLDRHEITRPMTAKEAIYLTKKDNGFGPTLVRYKRGDPTTRFDTIDSVIERAVALFGEMFDEDDVLVVDADQIEPTARHGDILPLAGPPEIVEHLKNTPGRRREEFLMERGYLVKDSEPEAEQKSA